MNAVQLLLQRPSAMALGWALLHFLWQGALIAALLGLANLGMRKASASARYLTASIAMLLMLAAGVATFVMLQDGAAVSSVGRLEAFGSTLGSATIARLTTSHDSDAGVFLAQARIWLAGELPWLVCIWSAGVLMLSGRSVGGWVAAQKLRKSSSYPADSAWLERLARLTRRLEVSRPVKLCESAVAKVPGVIGWLRPVILLPASALAGMTPEMLEAVLAHELAHVRRCDYLVNILQTAVETLLFYHPAVWWVGKKIREERENCCDDLAVNACGNALTYARALTELEQLRCGHAQLAMAATGGSLLTRIRRLIGVTQPAGRAFSKSMASVVVVVALLAVWGFGPVSVTNHNYDNPVIDTAGSGVELIRVAQAAQAPQPQTAPRAQAAPQPQAPPEPKGFIGELAASGYKNLSVDDLIQFKIHGVTPEIIRQIEAAGLGHPDADNLVAMRIHDVTPEFLNEMKAAGFSGLSVDDLVAFKIHGVNSARVKELRAIWGKLDADEVVSAQIHGLTPEYAQQIKGMGLGEPSFDDLIAMKIHGVTPEFANSLKGLGIKELDLEQLTAFKIHGVDPAKVRELQKMGFGSLTADDIVSMQIHGVTPEFVHALKEAGITKLDADDAVAARIHGVTPAFMQSVRKHGFNNLGIDQIIELKRYNILSEKDGN